jgi:TonB-linked SusC/RagA family outer membrane protein
MNASNLAKDSYRWNAFGTVDVTNTTSQAGMSSGIVERQLESYMIRLNYGFNERYLLTVSGRWDGASQLAEGHKWDFFPSAAFGWRIQQEDFLRDVEWLSNLKIRAGVGTTGNAAVEPYATIGSINSFYLPTPNGNDLIYVTNEPYYVKTLTGMANSELGWEKTTQWNFGVDFGFLNNRLSGQVDFYRSKTNDLLMSMTIPTLTGYSTTLANVGKTSNKGVEFTLNAIPVQTRDFEWSTNFNAAWQKDKIEELAYGKNDMVDNAWFIGQQLSVYYGYQNEGIWQDTPDDQAEMAKWNANGYKFTPGNVRPKDQNGDYKMDASDRVVIGNCNPNWTLGWGNTFTYKSIELGFQMFGRLGYYFNTGGESETGHSNQRSIDYWTPDNTDAYWQKPLLAEANSGSADQFSGLLGYQKASFIKMRNISIGWNVPRKWIQKATLKNLKVYAQAINPFSIYQSIDGFDLDTGRTYSNRSFAFGLEVGF